MPRLTITLTDEQLELLEEKSGDSGEYESKSEAVRNLIDAGEQAEEELADLRTKVERLEREKRQILEQRQEHTDLVEYVEDELAYREQPLSVRLRWWLFGKQQ